MDSILLRGLLFFFVVVVVVVVSSIPWPSSGKKSSYWLKSLTLSILQGVFVSVLIAVLRNFCACITIN